VRWSWPRRQTATMPPDKISVIVAVIAAPIAAAP
jgi:hypothetical protein